MLPPDDRADEPSSPLSPDDEPRHPFTYRAPVGTESEPATLTADDVADEARRNDTVLVGAAALLTALFACTTVADPRVLVHIATGRYLASHGVLPPATDVFSATASDRAWTSLSWLFDLLVAGLYGLGGTTALTVLQIVATIGVFLLIFTTHRAGISSWWAAFIVVVAAVAASPHLEARPVVVTLLGLAATLWLVMRYRFDIREQAIWWLVPLFLLWTNLDPRMFLGLIALLLYGAGELIGLALGRPGFEEGSRRAKYWMAFGAAAMASLVNPWTWRAPLGALRLYGEVDPAYRQYYGDELNWIVLPHKPLLAHPPAALLDTALLAAMLLALVAGVTLILNRRRIDFGQVALWAGFVGLGLLAGRECPTAAVVFAVLAIQNAEGWYRNTFRQTYGTDRAELVFSRGGRALTVLAFAALAALWLMGKIVTDDGRRPGFGLDRGLANQLDSLSELLEHPYDKKVFNFHASQGDLLIWLGLQPFIDHRLELYAARPGTKQDDLIALHDSARNALLADTANEKRGSTTRTLPDDLGSWKPTLDRFEVVQAMPPLTFPGPSYELYFNLLRSPDWRLGRLSAAGAIFHRRDVDEERLSEHLKEHGLNLSRDAFREPPTQIGMQGAWPRPRSWTDELVRPAMMPNELARGLHYVRHLEEAQVGRLRLPTDAAFAFAYLALRDSYAGLAKEPQSLVGYRALGRIYELLFILESQGSGVQMRRRLYQSLDAYGQALTIDSNDAMTHQRLISLYLSFNKMDLAQQARSRYEQITGSKVPGPEGEQAAEQWGKMWEQLGSSVDEVTKLARKAIEENQPRRDVALFAWQNGCTLLALAILDEEPELVADDPDMRRLRALLLLESARPQDAFEELSGIEAIAQQAGLIGWREALALACLALPDFERAEALWRDDAAEASNNQLATAMQIIPLAGPLHGPAVFPLWQTSQAGQAMITMPQEVAQGEFNAALCELEAGQTAHAEKTLSSLLERHPLTPFTVLASFYLEQIRGEPVVLNIGHERIEDSFDAFEHQLDRQIVTTQLRSAGPVMAPKPGSSRSTDEAAP